MFDSLFWICPFCNNSNETQSKAGPCYLKDFYMEDDIPLSIMEDLNGSEEVCTKCKKRLKLVFDLDIKINKKAIEPIDNLDIIELAYKQKLAKQKKARVKKKLS